MRLRRMAEEEIVLVVLLSVFAAIFLLVFAPTLLVADSWLTLVAGREVFENGLPSDDQLTVLAEGRTWTDQQWGAQLLLYGAHGLGGLPVVVLLTALAVVGAFVLAAAAARSLGASPVSVLLVFFPVILASPWAWTVRAQVLALPIYVALLWLLAREARRPTRHVYLFAPLLLLWANLHGSVALGALLTMLLGGIEVARARRLRVRSALLVLVPPLLVLATPYGPATTFRYYHLLLVDPPFESNQVTEWMWSNPDTDTFVFYVLAGLAVAIAIRGRRRLTVFELGALAFTFVGAVSAIRGIPWFAMACQVFLPVALGGRIAERSQAVRRINVGIATASVALVALAAGITLARDHDWFSSRWSEDAISATRDATGDENARVFATSRNANWLLWRIPELRGRIAWDIRFEIYSPETFERIVRFRGEQGEEWKSLADGYEVVVLETGQEPSHVQDFSDEPGARVLYEDDRVTVVLRRETT